MELKEAIVKRRTKRKFIDKKVPHDKLVEIIEYARYAPMGANLQGIKYILIEDEKLVKNIFGYTKWSGYHPENAPNENEQPTSYVAMLGDLTIKENGNFETDAGAAGTIICLVANDLGLECCWLGAINKEKISELLNIDKRYKLLYLIAVGYSLQESKTVNATGDIRYFTDESDVLTVPKRTTDELIIKNY